MPLHRRKTIDNGDNRSQWRKLLLYRLFNPRWSSYKWSFTVFLVQLFYIETLVLLRYFYKSGTVLIGCLRMFEKFKISTTYVTRYRTIQSVQSRVLGIFNGWKKFLFIWSCLDKYKIVPISVIVRCLVHYRNYWVAVKMRRLVNYKNDTYLVKVSCEIKSFEANFPCSAVRLVNSRLSVLNFMYENHSYFILVLRVCSTSLTKVTLNQLNRTDISLSSRSLPNSINFVW